MNGVKRIGVATAALIATAAMAGCSAAQSTASAPADPAPTAVSTAPVPVPVTDSVLSPRLPILGYEPTPTQAAEITYLTQRIPQECMREFGFSYDPSLSASAVEQQVRIAAEFETRRYGVSDLSAVRTYGYSLPTWTAGSAPAVTLAQLPAGEDAVLHGTVKTYDHRPVPRGGCLEQAEQQLVADGISPQAQQSGDSSPANLAASIQQSSWERAQSNPKVRAVFAKWSACMSTYGDHYATPYAAAGDPRWTKVTPLEIQTAEHDVACKRRVNLLGVEFAVNADYQNAAIAKNVLALTQLKDQLASQLASLRYLMSRYAR
jgi:hypothetical protein